MTIEEIDKQIEELRDKRRKLVNAPVPVDKEWRARILAALDSVPDPRLRRLMQSIVPMYNVPNRGQVMWAVEPNPHMRGVLYAQSFVWNGSASQVELYSAGRVFAHEVEASHWIYNYGACWASMPDEVKS